MRKLAVFLSVLLLVPALACAHVYLLQCSPDQDAMVADAPKKVTITFVGSVEPAFSKIEVYDPDGKKVSGKTKFLENDTVMEVELAEDLARGVYQVKWVCMSLDGHKQKGEYKFTIS